VTGVTDIRHAWTGEVPEQYARHDAWFRRNDPVLAVARELLSLGIVERQQLGEIDAAVRYEIDQAAKFADDSPFPRPETAFTHVWPQ
jgi:pyruvate dehydrogenase E1 component alpha subunit